MKNALVFAAVASCLTATGRAASPPPLPESLLACTKLQDVSARVRCYDTQIAAIQASAGAAVPAPPNATSRAPAPAAPTSTAAAAPGSPVAPSGSAAATAAARSAPTAPAGASGAPGSATTSAVSAPEQSPDAQFGRDSLPPAERPELHQPAQALISNITAMRVVRPQTFLISLANGQVWSQEGASTTAFFHVGDEARIKRGTLGSYHMWTEAVGEKNWVRVTRIR
jgi:hypothetical protein